MKKVLTVFFALLLLTATVMPEALATERTVRVGCFPWVNSRILMKREKPGATTWIISTRLPKLPIGTTNL
ncbi:hypothetical protein [Christensenella sp.]|uniref:hypothetical protein n=1 Tax=Christensenella sp. TaxID=1935934 RepID=UPI002B1F2B1B|nr:hypothetical protein [Christensenella sp.]